MRILQVVHSFPPDNFAGVETYTYNLCKQLARHHQVFVFYRVNNLRQKEYEVQLRQREGISIYSINNTFKHCYSFEGLYYNEEIAARFERLLDEINPQIVHIQHLVFLSASLIEKIKQRKIPILCTLHDYWFICSQWHHLKKDLSLCDNNDVSQCIDCLDAQLNLKKTAKQIYIGIRNVIPSSFLRLLKTCYVNSQKTIGGSMLQKEKIELRNKYMKTVCSMIDIFIAPSQYIKNRYIKFGIPEDKIEFLKLGIPYRLLPAFKKNGPPGLSVVGFIGTILPAKGVDVLINAFKRLPEKNITLRIYGKMIPYQRFEYYPSYLRRLAQNQKIQFMGGFNHSEIAQVFSEIDILVVPSLWQENSPLVVQEAFLFKTPIIASRVGGIPELIEDGKNGLLFEPGDTEGLAEKISLLVNNAGLIDKLKQGITLPKDISQHTEELERLYQSQDRDLERR